MDEPIVSIYDMLAMRYRQQRKEKFQQQKDLSSNRNLDRGEQSNSATQLRKTRSRVNHIKVPICPKSSQKMPGNVVTATHLTQKQPGIIIPQPTRKDVLNRLVSKMNGPNINHIPKQPAEPANLSQEPIENATQSSVSASKKRDAARTKTKPVKSTRASDSNNLGARLALSPRSTNRLDKPIAKPAKSSKLKNNLESKSRPSTPDAVRSKVRLRTRKSKTTTQLKEKESAPIENVVRYRL